MSRKGAPRVCRYCGSTNVYVVDTRMSVFDGYTRRRIQCMSCDKRYTTYEIVAEDFAKLKQADAIVKAVTKIMSKKRTRQEKEEIEELEEGEDNDE